MSNESLHLVDDESKEKTDEFDESLIRDWIIRLHNAQVGHYITSEALYKRADRYGYALITSSTIVTAMLFLNAEGWGKGFLVVMSIIAAILSGVVSFGRFAEKAEQHRSAASSYGKLRRQLEKLSRTTNKISFDEIDKKLKVLRIEWEYVSQNAPLTPRAAIREIENDRK